METINLKGKRILFFSAQFFGYQYEITKAMQRQGAIVDYFDERPANNVIVKALIRINRNLLSYYIDYYYRKIIQQTQKYTYDYIFITKGESISEKILAQIKKVHFKAKVIVYHWDSIANNKNALCLLPFVDRVYSFDKTDCIQYNLCFLPLFYIDDYTRVCTSPSNIKYEMLFVGTMHSDRYIIVEKIKRLIEGPTYVWLFFPSIFLYYKAFLQNQYFRKIPKEYFHFKSITKNEIISLFKKTKIILDIQHPKQTGLTMRCIEVLGARKKMITTNESIKDYDFYHPNNIYVIDRNNPVIDNDFLLSDYMVLPQDIYDKYSITGWLSQIFCD